MSRKTHDTAVFPSLTIEGNLLTSAMVSAIYALDAKEQDTADYGVRQGLSLRDELSLAFRVGQAHFDAFSKIETPNAAAVARFVQGMLEEAFGFGDLDTAPHPLALISGESRVPVVVVPTTDTLDKASETLSVERRRSAAFALQDHLNEHDEALWGLVTNGNTIRLMRDNASLTRPAYIEANIAQIFDTEDLASFAALWLLIHRSRFGNAGEPATDCALERWRDAGTREGEVARDRLAGQVEEALRALGSGFLDANPDLRERLTSGDLQITEWFNELLKLVYRLIFLMVAEDRNLLHPVNTKPPAREAYTTGFGLAHLRRHAVRGSSWDRHHDRFEGIKIVFNALAQGEPKLGLPALDGLFAADQMPDLRAAKLPNRAFMAAVYKLGWLKQDGALVPVNWRAMETEELGSVYESLLELQPQLSENGRELLFASDAAEQKGNQRKTTGSYYTPDSLVQALLDTALNPVLDRTEAKATDPAEALLNLTVIDPACGSGHFLLAAARRIATRVARHRATGTPSAADFRHAMRDVTRRCIFGADRNPMAVELTKVALWIETVDPGLPLGFFDANIRCGDSLLGVFDLTVLQDGIPDDAYKPLTGDDKKVAKYYLKANKDAKGGQGSFDFSGDRPALPTAPIASDFAGLLDLPEDTVEQVAAKAQTFRKLRKSTSMIRARMACNLYCAAFLLAKTGTAPTRRKDHTVPTSEDVWLALRDGKGRTEVMAGAQAARKARTMHWPLEFPTVMARGGFDVVLGNPPWERIKLQEKEFFAARDAAIATAPNAAARTKLIKALATAEPDTPERRLFAQFEAAKRLSEATSTFVRVDGDDGGRFPYTGTGDVNTYALFAELFSRLVRVTGRAGVIVPTGIATDATTAPFFAHLVAERRLARLVDFENSAPTFTAVHRSFKFCLLTLGRNEDQAHFAFFLTDTAQMAEPERNFTLSPEQIAALNPNTHTAPVFRSRADAELTTKIYSKYPILRNDNSSEQTDPWKFEYMTKMYDMADSSDRFLNAEELYSKGLNHIGTLWFRGSQKKPAYLPLFEAKMVSFFNHRVAGYGGRGEERGYRVLPDTKLCELVDPDFEPEPFYWVSTDDFEMRMSDRSWKRNWFMGWKDVAATTNERSLTPVIIPRIPVGHTIRLMFFDGDKVHPSVVASNLAAITIDYVARQKFGGLHLTVETLKQIPVLPPTFYTDSRLAFLTPRILELTYTSHSLAPFASDLGHDGPPFPWDEDRRADMRADLDAFYARAYDLTRDDLRYILDPKEVMGEDYPSETFRVLKDKEMRKYGEYRTSRLVLAAWDRMARDGTFTGLGM